ncbi:MAG: site-specific DNA-methyltransferase [Candidatus Atribacteria bacterium]|nr:site-specific DNA-methyltransferase [Candidatus Atribacteria bacterium]
MANHKTKLELTWIGKENRPKLEPRILVEDPAKSNHATFRVSDQDLFDNRLIFGDNLLALKALEQEFAGKVKCIYIDPPYNTGSAFTHYDDGLEHSLWLSLMRDRLEILRKLLGEDGSIWISIDDNECHYLKVMMDEVFGRANFIATIIWQKVYAPKSSAKFFSDMHDYIMVYATNAAKFNLNLMVRTDKQDKAYKNPDNDPRDLWRPNNLAARNYYSLGTYPITCPSGRVIAGPPKGSYWRFSEERFRELDRDGRIWWGKDGNNVPAPKIFLSEVKQGVTPQTMWFYQEVGHNQSAKKHLVAILPDVEELFITPKPEELIKRVFELGTNPGDLVLDSFAGSGTTGAVAQKMGRRWIMVELGEHCHTHIIPRLKKVIDGEDNGGITEAVSWKGGGGFRYYRLAPSLLQKDEFGNWVISKEYNPSMLAEAMCKLEGFTYAPSDTAYWQHGHSTETDFIYVTTQTLTRDQLQKLSDEVGEGRSLLIMCGAFRVKNIDEFPNLTVKKIPKAVLNRCEWGKDDYSLEIKNLPMKSPEEPEEPEARSVGRNPRSKAERRAQAAGQPALFELPTQEKEP